MRKNYGPEIQQAAGHEKYDTRDGYIRTARVFVGRVGEPFPPLPASMIASSLDHEFGSRGVKKSRSGMKIARSAASPTGFHTLLTQQNAAENAAVRVVA